MDRKINPNLARLAKLTQNSDLSMKGLGHITQSETPLRPLQKLEINQMGIPIVELTPLIKTAIHTPTPGEYDTLLQIYESGGWNWAEVGLLPTMLNFWEKYEENTCLETAVHRNEKTGSLHFGYAPINFFSENNYKIISPNKFYHIQGIPSVLVNEIRLYFNADDLGL